MTGNEEDAGKDDDDVDDMTKADKDNCDKGKAELLCLYRLIIPYNL